MDFKTCKVVTEAIRTVNYDGRQRHNNCRFIKMSKAKGRLKKVINFIQIK